MNFYSDNIAGILSTVRDAFCSVSSGMAPPYGQDELTQSIDTLFSEHFERHVSVLHASTGTAANALALATLCAPYEAILSHRHSHINEREKGAAEFFTQGAKLVPLEAPTGKSISHSFSPNWNEPTRAAGNLSLIGCSA